VYVSRVEGCLDLELSQIEHNKYTTTFNLTYRFTHDHRRPREPDMMIRLYHDARSCEVMSGLLQGLKHGPIRRRDLDEGYRLNRFLYKWMRYCLKQGHSFKKKARKSVVAVTINAGLIARYLKYSSIHFFRCCAVFHVVFQSNHSLVQILAITYSS